ncbi:hypothetical protein DFJ73DRAFT_918539 [Zopfochytrium polystomum]|nr:hypothetical protein DFJ73DRAFT_918539 [Zopfochytrium polystomum]
MADPLSFTKDSTAEQAAAAFAARAAGKHIVVTGANTGLGLETARALAAHGAVVTIAARSQAKGEAAVATVKNRHPDANVTFRQLDLSTVAGVDAFADAYLASGKPLDILICNAGVMACPYSLTPDGFENQFAVNHLAHFRLVTRLLPLLDRSGRAAGDKSRVVVLSSLAQLLFAPPAGIPFDDLDAKNSYSMWIRYGETKLANTMFAFELDRRCAAQGLAVAAASVHPGTIAATELARHNSSFTYYLSAFWNLNKKFLSVVSADNRTLETGSATTVLTALRPDLVGGKYYYDCQVGKMYQPKAYDVEQAERLWSVSEALVSEAAAKSRGA